jgi:hypothetical protein
VKARSVGLVAMGLMAAGFLGAIPTASAACIVYGLFQGCGVHCNSNLSSCKGDCVVNVAGGCGGA